MKTVLNVITAALICSSVSAGAQVRAFVGTWHGVTKLPSVTLTLLQAQDSLAGMIVLFDLHGKKDQYPISNVRINGKILTFDASEIHFSMILNGRGRYAHLKGQNHELELDVKLARGKAEDSEAR